MKHKFYRSCVDWPYLDVQATGGLDDMTASCIDITRRTFLQHVDREDLRQVESGVGGAAHPKQGLTVAGDWHVSYHRSKLHGRRVYYMIHSSTEYVFVPADYATDRVWI